MDCWDLKTCSAYDIIEDLDCELDLFWRATEIPWKATLHPLAYEKLRGTDYMYSAHGCEWIKVFENYHIPFVIHMRFAGLDETLPTRRPLGLGCWRGVDEQEHPHPPKPSWLDFVWELATRYAEPVFDRPLPVEYLYDFYEGRWHRFNGAPNVRDRLLGALLELEEQGKLILEVGELPDGSYRMVKPMILPILGWVD